MTLTLATIKDRRVQTEISADTCGHMYSYVYCIFSGGYYKIGASTNPIKRLQQLRSDAPDKNDMTLMWTVEATLGRRAEKEFHKWAHFSVNEKDIYRKEWYAFMSDSLPYVKTIILLLCAGFDIDTIIYNEHISANLITGASQSVLRYAHIPSTELDQSND